MRTKQNPKKRPKTNYRRYTEENLAEALRLCKAGVSIRKSSQMTSVPSMTIQNRICGKISSTTFSSGPAPLFSPNEENALVDHVVKMARVGYGYTRLSLRILATDTAAFTKKDRSLYLPKNVSDTFTNILSDMWLTKFLKRHPELSVKKPRKLDMIRAKSVTVKVIQDYFTELGAILDQHDLRDKPERVFNVDESGLSPDHNPHRVVGPASEQVPAITSGKGDTTTLIGCCSASGQALPPFFVFKGKRVNPDLLQGASPGCSYALSDSGWSNSSIFQDYLRNHLTKFIPQGEGPILLLYDGHSSHISAPLVEWAQEQNIILFVLPPHSSHLTQPLDVGCFGPFKHAYYQQCEQFMRRNVGQVITRYVVCSLACTAYLKSMTPVNITSAFRRTGIHPFDPTKIGEEQVAPSTVTVPIPALEVDTPHAVPVVRFLQDKVPHAVRVPGKVVKRNPRIQTGGKCISEGPIAALILEKSKSKFKPPFKSSGCPSRSEKSGSTSKKTVPRQKKNQKTPAKQSAQPSMMDSPEAGTSGLVTRPQNDSWEDSGSGELCCQCGLWSPSGLRNCVNLTIVQWAQCDQCNHWVHLRFCVPQIEVNSDMSFFCPCCSTEE